MSLAVVRFGAALLSQLIALGGKPRGFLAGELSLSFRCALYAATRESQHLFVFCLGFEANRSFLFENGVDSEAFIESCLLRITSKTRQERMWSIRILFLIIFARHRSHLSRLSVRLDIQARRVVSDYAAHNLRLPRISKSPHTGW